MRVNELTIKPFHVLTPKIFPYYEEAAMERIKGHGRLLLRNPTPGNREFLAEGAPIGIEQPPVDVGIDAFCLAPIRPNDQVAVM